LKSLGVIYKTWINLSKKSESCLKLEAPYTSKDYFLNFYQVSSKILGESSNSFAMSGYSLKINYGI
jgi:hypothetical protein